MKTKNLLSMRSQNGQVACETPCSLYLVAIVDCVGQVSVGLLPVGHTTSMHAIKYSESSE